MTAPGNVGTITLSGTFGSAARIGGLPSKLEIEGGDLAGLVDVAGNVGNITVSSRTEPVTHAQVGGRFAAEATVTVGGRPNRLKTGAYETGNDGQAFGVLARGLGRISLGGLTLEEEDVPLAQGDFSVTIAP